MGSLHFDSQWRLWNEDEETNVKPLFFQCSCIKTCSGRELVGWTKRHENDFLISAGVEQGRYYTHCSKEWVFLHKLSTGKDILGYERGLKQFDS